MYEEFKYIQRRTWELIEVAKEGDRGSRMVDASLMFLIIANVTALILGSSPHLRAQAPEVIFFFEYVPLAVFVIEYIVRVWSCVSDERYERSIVGRIKYMLTPLAIIDLIAILPFFLPRLFFGVDLLTLRLFRLLELTRILKFGRYTHALSLMMAVLKRVQAQIVTALFLLTLLIVVGSTLLYHAEHAVQPEVFSDIPHSLWWGVVTVTTVGYGDTVPMTIRGKIISTGIMMLGVILYGLPAAIFSHGFFDEFRERRSAGFLRKKHVCPHCGKEE